MRRLILAPRCEEASSRPALWLVAALLLSACFAPDARAIPLYARQTGQNCLACHAGGQFPELTPYGRKFKLTGYTLGERTTVPLTAMAVASFAKVNSTAGSDTPATDFPRNGQVDLTTVSLFCCGKMTENIGIFAQWTHDLYDHQDDAGKWIGHSHIDQVDVRFADRFIDTKWDLIYGLSLNNNPGVTDVWNTFNSAFTPVPTYTPVANALASTVPFDVPAGPFDQSLGQNSVGVTAYAYFNDTIYLEAGAYKAADGFFSILGQPLLDPFTRLKGASTFLRVAVNHDWKANSAMIGMHALSGEAYLDPMDRTSPTAKFQDVGVDGQYQYILDPHVVTAMFSYTREKQTYADELWNSDNPDYVGAFENSSNTLDYVRLKLTYSYLAKYGVSLAYTTVKGSPDEIAYAGNDSNRPDSRLWIPEVFYQPIQYVRIGLQYYKWDRYLGVQSNYDPNGLVGRNARDNNSVFLYMWAAY
jgi:hypothetical protein